MKSHSNAIAYPGLPVVFAEGFRDYRKRISGHSHASFAITDAYETVKTETSAETVKAGVEFTFEGKRPADPRSSATMDVIREMISLAAERTGVNVSSINHGILTGSSDSGAAALVTALDDLLGLNLPLWQLNEIASRVSETAYRSLIGGLSEHVINDEGDVRIRQLKKASAFKDLMIYAIPFDLKRFSADDLHKRVSQHPRYSDRQLQVEYRLENLNNLARGGDLQGILELMESEARTVHQMFNDLGMEVIKPDMREVTELVQDMRSSSLKVYWNVAGGSTVYVFTLKKHAKEVTRELKDRGFKYKHFKVADGARVI
ncbi:MAG: hypothetical protein GF416_03370 [Candidatus Altiarchaeales archaeon]|nr:hypothetical protein [Candidatus Altiarchaeales archaeon]MBD3416159.1 hypothetical protein [Candidatus Altiarchaeales archaeon]